MKHLHRQVDFERVRRAVRACAALAVLWLLAAPSIATASLLPAGFFDMNVKAAKGSTAVEADRMTYDAATNTVSAEGSVLMSYDGNTIKADRIDYNQKTGDITATGHVIVRDPSNNQYAEDSLKLTGRAKEAFVQSLTLTTAQGAVVTADNAHYIQALETILTDATYSPCGLCIDSKGRHIGWSVKAARIIYDRNNASVTLEQPSLALLGIPVAWVPWLAVPDPTQPRARGFRMPQFDWNGQRGASVTVPFFVPLGENAELLLSPELMSRQGALLSGNLSWRFPNFGAIDIRASGVYQLDPQAYDLTSKTGVVVPTVGDRQWRGAIQTSGHFTPLANWTAGWSYSIFSDNQYLSDYEFNDLTSSTNEVYGTYLNELSYLDIRVQKFNRLGDFKQASDDQQGLNLPKATFDTVKDLQPGWGRLHFSGELLAVSRAADQFGLHNGIPYIYGYEGNKQHLELEGAWEDQFILPAGLTATPYVGARLDAAHYDGASSLASAPDDSMLLSATPIAAVDFRWPLVSKSDLVTQLLEPVAQIVYRGSDDTLVGITNDDAQSFVFDTSNLFSYNRFSGIDRQETGLRANLGGHYLANFSDGSWLDLVAGELFHLLGTNALGITDPVQVGTDTGLGGQASYIVASATGGLANGFSAAGKIQIDPAKPRVTEGGAGAQFTFPNELTLGADYIYIAADPALGTVKDQHEIALNSTFPIPFTDYWSGHAGVTWDVATNTWLEYTGGITYDDKYLLFGADGDIKPDSWGVGVRFKLKGPDGKDAF